MDPAQVVDLYSRILTAHIFEALYDYDHLARPFKIRPSTAAGMPEVTNDFRTYTVRIKPGIYFQDDPAFKGKPSANWSLRTMSTRGSGSSIRAGSRRPSRR